MFLPGCAILSSVGWTTAFFSLFLLISSLLVPLLPTCQERASQVSTPSSKHRKWYRKYYSSLSDCSRKTCIKLFTEANMGSAVLVLTILHPLEHKRLWVTAQHHVSLLLLGETLSTCVPEIFLLLKLVPGTGLVVQGSLLCLWHRAPSAGPFLRILAHTRATVVTAAPLSVQEFWNQDTQPWKGIF